MKIHRPIASQIPPAIKSIFEEGYYADKAVEYYFRKNKSWGGRDRRFFAECVYEIVRWYRSLVFVAGYPWNDNVTSHRSEDFYWGLLKAWLFINDILLPDWMGDVDLELIAERAKKLASHGPETRESYPDWLYQRMSVEVGEENWPNLAAELNRQAPLFLRANRLKVQRKKLLEDLINEGVEVMACEEGVEDTLILTQRTNVFRTKAFANGWFEVQDAHSQLVAPLLEVEPGMTVVDACAGAGGKSLHLSALLGNRGRVIAMDIHESKLKELKRRARRAGATNIEPRWIDSTKVIKRLEKKADRVLLDVPCSGLGVLRRNPDTKWKISPCELERLSNLQKDILSSYSRMVKPGGKLVYATCSVLPSENQRVVEAFLAANEGQWTLEKEETHWPSEGAGDGFYAARLMRKS